MPSPLYASMECVWHSQMRRMKTQMQTTTTRKMAFAGSIIQRLCVDQRVELYFEMKIQFEQFCF